MVIRIDLYKKVLIWTIVVTKTEHLKIYLVLPKTQTVVRCAVYSLWYLFDVGAG